MSASGRVGSTTSTASARSRSGRCSRCTGSPGTPRSSTAARSASTSSSCSAASSSRRCCGARAVPARLGAAWWVFVKRRVIRLYPALLGLVVVAVVLYAVTPSAPLGPLEVARRGVFALTQASAVWAADQSGSFWLPALHPFGQTWSLAIEWYFYLLWPLVVLAARARGCTARPRRGRQPGGGGPALPGGPAAERLLVLLRPVRALRRAARRCRAGAVVPGQRHSRRVRAAARHRRVGRSRWLPSARSRCSPRPRTHPLYRYVEVPVAVLATVVLIYAGYSNASGSGAAAAQPSAGSRPSVGAATASTCGTSSRCCCWRRPASRGRGRCWA